MSHLLSINQEYIVPNAQANAAGMLPPPKRARRADRFGDLELAHTDERGQAHGDDGSIEFAKTRRINR